MGRYLSPRYNHVILVSEWRLIKHNMDASTLAKKCDVSHWLSYGADGCKVTLLPKFLGWIDNQNLI